MPKQAPAVTLDPNSPIFQTPDGAADAVSKNFVGNEQSAIVIKRPDGTYGYSTVTPQQQETAFALRALLAKGHSMAAIVHNHPGGDDAGQVFSPDDINTAKQFNVPSFIRFNKDSSIRRYTPGQTKTKNMPMSGQAFGYNVAAGDPIAQEPPPAASPGVVDSPVVARDNNPTQY